MIVDRALVEAALPGYEIGAELGRGGFGLVLAGRHRRLTRPVAIKILSVDADEDMLARFAAEAQILANIDHPHVVRVHDYIEVEGLCLIVMEQLPGGTLRRRTGGTRTPEAVCAVGLAVAEALGCAHAAGVLHRDVKPGNILVAADGMPKVTDFGIAKIFEGSAGTASALIGTWQYMAPEQWRNDRLKPATDIYALGVVLYELLVGHPPFGAKLSPAAMMQHHLDVVPPAPAGVPEPVATVVLRALAKDAANRQQTARVFAVELARAAAEAFGRDWLAQSEVPLMVADEVRDAARPIPLARQPQPPSRLTVPPPAGTHSPPAGMQPTATAAERAHEATPTLTSNQTDSGPIDTPRPDSANDGERREAGGRPSPPQAPSQPFSPPLPPSARSSPAPPRARPRAPSADSRSPRLKTPVEDFLKKVVSPYSAAALIAVMGVLAFLFLYLLGDENKSEGSAGPSSSVSPSIASPPTPVAAYDGPTIHAQLSGPTDIAIDGAGNLYIADYGYSRIQMLGTDGKINTVAGTGDTGFSGDGGPAAQARLNNPAGVAVDTAGNLYIADEGNHRIRRVGTDGKITTVAGTGKAGFSGDDGAATQAQLNGPNGVAVDSAGNLYIADRGSHRVRRVDADGRISTVAGTGTAGSSGDGGPATQARLNEPTAVELDSTGTLYITDVFEFRVRRVTPDGKINTVAGTGEDGFSGDGGPATQAKLQGPVDLTVDPTGNIYIADYKAYRVRRVALDGRISTVAGTGQAGFSGDGGPATRAQLIWPNGVTVDASGNLFITDYTEGRLRRVDADGRITTVVD